MFSTTFLGHQGWTFQTDEACLLVDPLLREEFGEAQALEYRVHPPRDLRLEALPPVDAVVLTHEHDDHFDLPSLALLDRRIPILLSARSSTAAHHILRQMGFQVRPLVPATPVRFGDLEVLPLWGDHVQAYTADEWDTLPYLVSQTGGDGSFFSAVDVEVVPAHIELVRQRCERPGLVAWTNNALDWSHVFTWQSPPGDQTAHFAQLMDRAHGMIAHFWGEPAATLTCAGGFSFCGEQAWLNQRVFHADMDRLCRAMEALYPTRRVVATRPGQTFRMLGNQLVETLEEAAFLGTAPMASWPARVQVAIDRLPDYPPATGRTTLTDDDVALLHSRLAEFARMLVGSPLFKALYSIPDAAVQGRAPTFAFALRDAQRPLVLEYNPNGCIFQPGRMERPYETYLAGMECWGSDLLAVLGGELGQTAIGFGRSRFWNAMPEHFSFDLPDELQRVSHPLSRPAEYLRTYERIVAAHPVAAPPVRAR